MAGIGIPRSVPPGLPGATAGVALTLVPGSSEPTWLNAGAAEAQLCGTDSMPSEAARPTPADTAAFPIPGVPSMPVPLPSADPNDWSWLPAMLAAAPTDCMSELAGMPEVDIDPDEPVADARLMPDVSAVDDEVRVDSGNVDEDDIDEAAEASPALGTTALSGVDMAVVSGDTV